MKVKELINKLNNYPDNMEVGVEINERVEKISNINRYDVFEDEFFETRIGFCEENNPDKQKQPDMLLLRFIRE